MKNLKAIDVSGSLASAKEHLSSNATMDQSTKSIMGLLITIIELLVARFGANSKNSSVPPSQDPNAETKKRPSTGNKPGGQAGRTGKNLSQVENPDEIVEVKIDPKQLPAGVSFKELAPEKRQVIPKVACSKPFALCKQRFNTGHLCVDLLPFELSVGTG